MTPYQSNKDSGVIYTGTILARTRGARRSAAVYFQNLCRYSHKIILLCSNDVFNMKIRLSIIGAALLLRHQPAYAQSNTKPAPIVRRRTKKAKGVKKIPFCRRSKKEAKNGRVSALDFLHWDLDPWMQEEDPEDNVQRLAIPSLTQPFYNSVVDVRATVSAKDVELIFSTNGNWQLALMKLLDTKYFPENESVKSSYLITTSPPISVAQMETGLVKVGNILYKDAEPHVVVAPGKVITALKEKDYILAGSEPKKIIQTYGNVILKRKGDDSIQSFEDLYCIEPGRFASSDPAEAGSYGNYKDSVYNIAFNLMLASAADPGSSEATAIAHEEALALQTRLFDDQGVATIGAPMHRSLPHMIATGQADAGLIFLHLAVFAMNDNPGVFEAVYLASDKDGSTDDSTILALGQEPMEGNKVGTFSVVQTNTPLNNDQEKATAAFLKALDSAEFTDILTEVGLRRP